MFEIFRRLVDKLIEDLLGDLLAARSDIILQWWERFLYSFIGPAFLSLHVVWSSVLGLFPPTTTAVYVVAYLFVAALSAWCVSYHERNYPPARLVANGLVFHGFIVVISLASLAVIPTAQRGGIE